MTDQNGTEPVQGRIRRPWRDRLVLAATAAAGLLTLRWITGVLLSMWQVVTGHAVIGASW